jgi:hypothetical protein
MPKKNPDDPKKIIYGTQSQRQEKIETRNLANFEDNLFTASVLSRNKLIQSNSKVSVGLLTPKRTENPFNDVSKGLTTPKKTATESSYWTQRHSISS